MAKTPRSTRKSVSVDPTPPAPQANEAAGAMDQLAGTPAGDESPIKAPPARRPRKPGNASAAATDATAATPAAGEADRASTAGARKSAARTPAKPRAAAAPPAPKGDSPAPKPRRAPVRKTAAPVSPVQPTAEVVHGVTPEEASQGAITMGTAPAVQAEPASPVSAIPTAAASEAKTATTEPAAAPAIAEQVAQAVVPVSVPPVVLPQAAHGRSARILFIASEAVPFAKTGGLADVVAALPKALGALGHDVTVVIPRYRGIGVSGAPTRSYPVAMGGHRYQAEVFVQETSPGVRVALVDHPAFFDRDALYGLGSHDYGDNPRRFAFLSLAALEFARLEGQPVDIVHAHDWQAGLAPVYLRTRYASDPVLGGAASVFTIHNVAYQGNFSSEWLPQLGLGWELFTIEGLEFWLHASFLKGGIMFADLVTTVSPRYAQELMTPLFAFGFEGVLRHRAADLMGILNGIDTEVWNPGGDKYLPKPYSADDLSGKADAKRVLLDTYGLPAGDDLSQRPVVAMISRMVDQKGLDLIAAVSEQLPHLGAAFVILGTGEPWYEEMWRSLARRYPDRVGVRIGFDEPLSHVIEAGADIFMMPSRFEPCGLNQMYSLRYGTLPVVRATGGLDDTVKNYDPSSGAGNGFKFYEASGEALLGTIRWALRVYHDDAERWRQLQRAGMAEDFSWNASARAYLDAYARARTHASGRQAAASI